MIYSHVNNFDFNGYVEPHIVDLAELASPVEIESFSYSFVLKISHVGFNKNTKSNLCRREFQGFCILFY